MLNSLSLTLNQCYSPNTFFTASLSTPLTLDWGTGFGQANFSSGNPYTVGTNQPWITNIDNVSVGVNVGTDFTLGTGGTKQIARADNEVYVWDSTRNFWLNPQFPLDGIHTDITYDGHFAAPGPATVAGDGAHLLEMYDNATGSFDITFSQGMSAVGFLLSVKNQLFNSNFDATIKAYDNNSNLLATYVINTAGVGGQCAGLNDFNNPVACNDAPFIGVKAPGTLNSQQIYRIVVSATTSGNLDSLLIDSLVFQEAVPEPAVVLLCGAGLVLIGVMRRKRVRAGRVNS